MSKFIRVNGVFYKVDTELFINANLIYFECSILKLKTIYIKFKDGIFKEVTHKDYTKINLGLDIL